MNKGFNTSDSAIVVHSFEELASLQGPVKDFFWKGQPVSLIEKTDQQIENIHTVHKAIKNYFLKRGVQVVLPPLEHYLFLTGLGPFGGTYMANINRIILRSDTTDIHNIIHETLHYISSHMQYIKGKESKHARTIKSGFFSAWSDDEVLFPWLNEGVTEKIAREVGVENGIMYDKKPVTLEQEKQYEIYVKKRLYELLIECKEKHAGDIGSNEYSNSVMKAYDEGRQKYNIGKISTYDSNIAVLDNILLTVCYNRYGIESNKSMYDYYTEVWDEIVKNYLKGNMMRLRERECIFGKGFLEIIANTPELPGLDESFLATEKIIEKTVTDVFTLFKKEYNS